jgi:Domain of unknown function (DUF4258)
MSELFRRIQALVLAGDYLISDHAYEEMIEDGILLSDVVDGIASAFAIESYPDRVRVLVLQHDAEDRHIHVVWSIHAERHSAVLVTAYRPSPRLWSSDFKRRKTP